MARASGRRTAWTWLASSRVGTRIRPRGRPAMVYPSARAATRGMQNASVLPEPVWPRPSTSRPASVSVSVAAWIGNGAMMPPSASVVTTGAGTPRSANERPGWIRVGLPDRRWRPRRALAGRSRGRTVK